MGINYERYTLNQLEEVTSMAEKGWIHILYDGLIELIAKEIDIVVTSKGNLIYFRLADEA